MDDLVLHRRHVRTVEGPLPPGRVRENRPEREDVGRRADALPEHLLGSAVARGHRDLARGGQGQSVLGSGDAEVDDARAARGQHDVGRLEVSVDQVRRMNVLESTGEGRGERTQAGLVQGPVRRDRLLQRGPGEELSRDPRPSALGL